MRDSRTSSLGASSRSSNRTCINPALSTTRRICKSSGCCVAPTKALYTPHIQLDLGLVLRQLPVSSVRPSFPRVSCRPHIYLLPQSFVHAYRVPVDAELTSCQSHLRPRIQSHSLLSLSKTCFSANSRQQLSHPGFSFPCLTTNASDGLGSESQPSLLPVILVKPLLFTSHFRRTDYLETVLFDFMDVTSTMTSLSCDTTAPSTRRSQRQWYVRFFVELDEC